MMLGEPREERGRRRRKEDTNVEELLQWAGEKSTEERKRRPSDLGVERIVLETSGKRVARERWKLLDHSGFALSCIRGKRVLHHRYHPAGRARGGSVYAAVRLGWRARVCPAR